jgi:hypothetical protein
MAAFYFFIWLNVRHQCLVDGVTVSPHDIVQAFFNCDGYIGLLQKCVVQIHLWHMS